MVQEPLLGCSTKNSGLFRVRSIKFQVRSQLMRILRLASQQLGILLVFGLMPGCGSSVTSSVQSASTAGCSEQAAQIGVGDGYLTPLCGCKEVAGTVFFASSLLTCTVSRGTTVFFQYLGTNLPHQIISTGQPSFMSSPISRPNDPARIRVHAAYFTESGTYSFQDQMQNGVIGQVVVQ